MSAKERLTAATRWTGSEDLPPLPPVYDPRYRSLHYVLATPQVRVRWVPGVQGIEGVGHKGDPIRTNGAHEQVHSPEPNAQPRALRMGNLTGTGTTGVEPLVNWPLQEPKPRDRLPPRQDPSHSLRNHTFLHTPPSNTAPQKQPPLGA